MRVSFDEVFSIGSGRIQSKLPVRVNGVTMTPGGSFSGGVSFGGLDLSKIAGRDLEVEQDSAGVVEIKGYY